MLPGTQAGTLGVYATAGSGYFPDTVVPLSGTVVASAGYLTINQTTVSFGGVFVGGAQPSQASRSVVLSNKGSTALTFQGFAWQDYYANGMPFNNVTSSTVGNGYTATSFPAVGSTLAPGASLTIPLVFSPSSTGISASTLTFWSDGGYTDLLMQGTAAQGTVSSSSTTTSTTSSSSSQSSSSPVAATSTSSIATSSTLSSTTTASSATISTSSSTPSSQSTTTGTTTSVTSSTTVSTPTGPTNLATIGSYSYVGCYTEATTGRALTGKAYANDNMTIEICYAQCAGYTWFGLEYHRECEPSRVTE